MLDGNVLLRQECDEVPKGTCLALTEFWRIFIIIVAMRGYIRYSLSVTKN